RRPCGDVDLVVSTVPHSGMAAERAVLRGGGALLNVASMTAAARAVLEAEQEDARGLVVVHAGLAPGVTTLVAAELLLARPGAGRARWGRGVLAAARGGAGGPGSRTRAAHARRPPPRGTRPPPPAVRPARVSRGRQGDRRVAHRRCGRARHAPAHLPGRAFRRRGDAHPERPASPLGAAAGGVRRRAGHSSPPTHPPGRLRVGFGLA